MNIVTIRLLAVRLLAVAALLSSAHGQAQTRWYKGNSHMHSNRSDGELPPASAAKWYNDNNYDFLVLTDHRVFLGDHDITVTGRRDDFLIVTGEEFHSLNGFGDNHTTVINAETALGDVVGTSPTVWEHFNKVYTLAESRKGLPFINHPTWASLVSADDFMKIKGFRHFEVFNGAQDTDNYGMFGTGMPPIENLWDSVLSRGAKFYGVGSDDMHKFNLRPAASNPMTGWTMVKASRLDVPEIVAAYRKGDFYATNGVMLKDLDSRLGHYRVAVDEVATKAELARRDAAGFANPARPVKTGSPGFRIEFIGPKGKVLKTVVGDTASFQVTNDLAYVRARVTYLRTIKAGGAPYDNYLKQADYVKQNTITREEYYAWGQPYFTDARREGPALVFGCTDPAYFEYSAAANVLEPGACKNKSTGIRILPPGDPSGPGIAVTVSPTLGEYALYIRALDGRTLRIIPSNAARAHVLGNLALYGTYAVEIRGRGKALWKTVHLR